MWNNKSLWPLHFGGVVLLGAIIGSPETMATAQSNVVPQLKVEKAETYTLQDPVSRATLRAVKITLYCSALPSFGELTDAAQFQIVDDQGNHYGDIATSSGSGPLPTPGHYEIWYLLEYKPIPKRAIGKVSFKANSWSVGGVKFPVSVILQHHS